MTDKKKKEPKPETTKPSMAESEATTVADKNYVDLLTGNHSCDK